MICQTINYTMWAQEYEEQTQNLGKHIAALKEKRKNCNAAYMADELTKRINSLYNMYLESRHTAIMMKKRAKEDIQQ